MKIIQFPRFNYQQVLAGQMSIIEPNISTSILENAPMGVIITDADERISWINKTMQGFLNVTAEAMIGQSFTNLCNDFQQNNESEGQLWLIPAQNAYGDRWLLQVREELSPGMNAHYFSDSSELVHLKHKTSQLADQLENTATSDPLTGVLNKRALMQGLEPQVSRSRRYENPLSIIILDIDEFNASDESVSVVTEHVLRGIGFYLRDQLRWVDMVGRTGEREFTLVLPETGLADAQNIASKITQRLSQLSLPETPEVTVKVDSKIGIAEWQKGNDTSRLLDRAREAMEDWAETA